MNRNARAIVTASTGAILITLLSRFHNPISYQLGALGRYALRGLYMTLGMNAGRLPAPILLSFSTVTNLLGWFLAIFLIARLFREGALSRMPAMTTVCFLILRTMAITFLVMAVAFAVYTFVVPDRRHGNMWAILMTTFCVAAAVVPAVAAFVLRRMTRT